MNSPQKPFWKEKPLAELSREEWESLCDGCARCCLYRLEDEDTGEIHFTNVHCRLLDTSTCRLYELYDAWPQDDGTWSAGSGAIFDLNSNDLRPQGWTSADAAGLPILPGLVRYDEVEAGFIGHALRFTAPRTRRAYLWPARHYASSLTAEEYPPMGTRFRLKGDYDISGFAPQVQVILQALKTYGMILADNGGAWYLSGVPDERWDNDALAQLKQLKGRDFEAVDTSGLMLDEDSGQAAP